MHKEVSCVISSITTFTLCASFIDSCSGCYLLQLSPASKTCGMARCRSQSVARLLTTRSPFQLPTFLWRSCRTLSERPLSATTRYGASQCQHVLGALYIVSQPYVAPLGLYILSFVNISSASQPGFPPQHSPHSLRTRCLHPEDLKPRVL